MICSPARIRRRALGVCAAGLGAAAAAAVVGAPSARADSTLVSATVFTGTTGAAAAQSVSLSTLQACPAYAGPGALTLHPQGSTDTLAVGATWTLSEIVSCGLQVPLSDVTDVQVVRPDGAAEAPLSPSELSDPSVYADPAAPGALPVISNDGGQAINIYTRPWRGGSDDNAADQVSESGPIAVDVYENAPPLVVHIHATPLHRGTASERVSLSATVTTAAGAPVAAGALAWQWTLSTGRTSTTASPTATIPARATTTVALQVSDAATGTGGTADVALAYMPKRSTTAHHDGGGGDGRRASTSGLGAPARHRAASGRRTHGGGASASGSRPGTATSTTTTSTASTTTTAAAATHAAPAPAASATTTASASTATTPAAAPTRRPATHHHRAAPARASGTLVRGQLIGDVAAPAPAPTRPTPASPAAAAASSPDVAGHVTVPGAVIAAAIVLALLGLGASRERWARSRRLHR